MKYIIYKGPAIYWFKIKLGGNSSKDKIINRFSSIRNQKPGWWSKAKKVAGKQTEYVYVGKVEKKLYDRFTQHMGLGHKMTSSLNKPTLQNHTHCQLVQADTQNSKLGKKCVSIKVGHADK